MNQLPSENPASGSATVTDAQSSAAKRKFPVGLILIIILVGMGIVAAPMALARPTLIFGSTLVSGTPVVLYNLILLGVNIALFVGLIRRKEWARVLGIVLSAYYICFGILQQATLLFERGSVMAMYNQLIPGLGQLMSADVIVIMISVITLFNCGINAAVLLYLVYKKRYFRR